MGMTDDDAYDLHRDRAAERGRWPRRRRDNGDAARNRHRAWIEKLDRPWMKAIYLQLWPY